MSVRILAVTNTTSQSAEDFAYLYNTTLAESSRGDFRLMGLETGSHSRVRSTISAALHGQTVQSVDAATCDEATADVEAVLLGCSLSEQEQHLDDIAAVEDMRRSASQRLPQALGNHLHGSAPVVDRGDDGNAVCTRFYADGTDSTDSTTATTVATSSKERA